MDVAETKVRNRNYKKQINKNNFDHPISRWLAGKDGGEGEVGEMGYLSGGESARRGGISKEF